MSRIVSVQSSVDSVFLVIFKHTSTEIVTFKKNIYQAFIKQLFKW